MNSKLSEVNATIFLLLSIFVRCFFKIYLERVVIDVDIGGSLCRTS